MHPSTRQAGQSEFIGGFSPLTATLGNPCPAFGLRQIADALLLISSAR
jgi:hypothetical protein